MTGAGPAGEPAGPGLTAAVPGPTAEAPPTEAGIVECADGVATLRPLTPDEIARMDRATIGRPVDPSDPDAVHTVVMDHGEAAGVVDGATGPVEAVPALPITGTDMMELEPDHPCAVVVE